MKKAIVLLQIYALDRLEEISNLLDIHKDTRIAISIGEKNTNDKKIIDFLNKFKARLEDVRFHKNYGVDIAPFLQQVKRLDSDKFPYFIKLHSKSSFFGNNLSVDWGSILIDTFIGNAFCYDRNLSRIEKSHIGMVSNRYFTLANNLGKNISKIKGLCKILDVDYQKVTGKPFAAGSMFLSKTSIFHKYLLEHIDYLDILLSNETGKVHDANHVNGTYSHALERLFGYFIHNENLKIHPSILNSYRVYNTQYKKLHLHITYNNIAYLTEDSSIIGKVIENNEEILKIEWKHLKHNNLGTYQKFNHNNLIRINHAK